MVEPLGHRQTKEAGTRMPDLTSPRHIPTLPTAADFRTIQDGPQSLRVIRRLPVTWQCVARGGRASDKPRGRKPRAGMDTTVRHECLLRVELPRSRARPGRSGVGASFPFPLAPAEVG